MKDIIAEVILTKDILVNNQIVKISNKSIFLSKIEFPVAGELIKFNLLYNSLDILNTYIDAVDGNIHLLRNSNFLLKLKLENIIFNKHNGYIKIMLNVDNNDIKEYKYTGPGSVSPSYGFENIYFSDKNFTSKIISFRITEVYEVNDISIIVQINSIPL